MAKGARKSRRSRSVGAERSLRLTRPPGKREPKKTVLIMGEGRKTEPYYFHGLKKDARVSSVFHVVVKGCDGASPMAAVEKAVKERELADYDYSYCVLDVECPPRPDLSQALALAGKKKITAILSNPCFEVWFLAHFKRTCQPFNSADAAIKELNKHWQKQSKSKYDKSDRNVYEHLSDRTGQALENARAVREKDHKNGPVENCNSSTEVDKLVGHLLQA